MYTPSHVSSTYTFIGITRDWNVVLFGDEVTLAEEGSTAKKITPASSSSSRSLFQDIFGKSAFSGSEIVPPLSTERPSRPWTGKESIDIFDAPAYLMPPLGSLYDHIMDGLLKPQPESSHDENVKSHDEDVEMDEEDENVISTGTRQPRIVSREEIDTFTELFRKHSIRRKSIFYPGSDNR
jgi:NET1-associated nuclear protein 1 (U3 small nucleolar RNA-associated protein 17)